MPFPIRSNFQEGLLHKCVHVALDLDSTFYLLFLGQIPLVIDMQGFVLLETILDFSTLISPNSATLTQGVGLTTSSISVVANFLINYSSHWFLYCIHLIIHINWLALKKCSRNFGVQSHPNPLGGMPINLILSFRIQYNECWIYWKPISKEDIHHLCNPKFGVISTCPCFCQC